MNMTAGRIESELTISLQRKMYRSRFSHSIAYFCRISFSNGTILAESQEMNVQPQYIYAESSIEGCDKNIVHSTASQRCIDPEFYTAETSSHHHRNVRSVTTDSPKSAPLTKATTPQQQRIQDVTSNTPLMPKTDSTKTSSTSQIPFTQTSQLPDEDLTEEFVFDEQFLIISAIGAAILLIIVVLFLLICLCVCNRLCEKSGYCTCCV